MGWVGAQWLVDVAVVVENYGAGKERAVDSGQFCYWFVHNHTTETYYSAQQELTLSCHSPVVCLWKCSSSHQSVTFKVLRTRLCASSVTPWWGQFTITKTSWWWSLRIDCWHILGCAKRGEVSFLGDTLVEVEENAVMCNGKDYTEERNLKCPYYMMHFYFMTHSYSSYVETIIADLYQRPADIIISGTLQDMARKQWSSTDWMMQQLFKTCKRLLDLNMLFIWATALPVSKEVRGGVIL